MSRLDPTAATAKWVTNLGASTPSITAGVNAVTTAPGQLAAAQSAKWLQKIQASQAKWKKNVAAVSLAEWQNAMLTIGVNRIAQGAQAKQSKYQAFAASFFPYLQAGKAAIDKMPSITLEDGIARATAQIRYNANYAGKNS